RRDESVQPDRYEERVTRGDLVEGPPSQLVDVLCVHLLPRQSRHGLERVTVDEMDAFALPIELAVQERHDVQPMPDLRADDGLDQADLLLQLAAERIDVRLARIEPASWQRPTCGRRELEAHQ